MIGDVVDPVQDARRELIQTSNVVIIVLVSLLSLTRWGMMGFGPFPFPALMVVLGATLNGLYVRRSGSLDLAAWTLVALMLGGLFFGALNTGAYSGPVVLMAPLIPLYAMLLVNSQRAWISLVLVSLVLLVVLYLDYSGVVPQNPNERGMVLAGRFITLVALCLVCTVVVWRFAFISRGLLELIERQSVTDYLTGVFNRRGVEAILLREVSRARRADSWLSVIIADIDHFKRFNDANGHQSGDRCLVDVARIITACSERMSDVVGRFGGEEFVVVLPETGPAGAAKVAEDMRRNLVARKISYSPGSADTVTMTLGVVSARGVANESVEQLFRQADAALYRGKSQGRNCVVSEVLDRPA